MKEGFTAKRCPKCGGNIFLDRDFNGWYEQCLMCSYRRDLTTVVEVLEKVSTGAHGQAGKERSPEQ